MEHGASDQPSTDQAGAVPPKATELALTQLPLQASCPHFIRKRCVCPFYKAFSEAPATDFCTWDLWLHLAARESVKVYTF